MTRLDIRLPGQPVLGVEPSEEKKYSTFFQWKKYRDTVQNEMVNQNKYVAVPRKQLNQDFGTNMLLKPKLGINFKLTMAPDIPQCTLKMISIKTGPPFYVNEVK